MNMVIGGLIGGLIGAAVWAGIVYTTNYEIGWIAIGVGFLVGFGVRIGDNEKGNDLTAGIISVVIAVGAIALAKFLVVYLLVNSTLAAMGVFDDVELPDKDMIAKVAYVLVEEKEAAGEKLNLPPAYYLDDVSGETKFPKEIWTQATAEWNKLSTEKKISVRKEVREGMNKLKNEGLSGLYFEAFKESLGGMDIVFFLIAAYTAFNVGSGKND